MKKALQLRARADRQARALASRLATALALGDTAADHISRINTLYGTNVSERTDLVEGYRQAGTVASLAAVAGASLDGTPVVVFANIADGNGGVVLAGDADLD